MPLIWKKSISLIIQKLKASRNLIHYQMTSNKYNAHNISRNINSQIKKEVLKRIKDNPGLKDLDVSFHKPGERATDPLSMLKIHAQLRKVSQGLNHLRLYRMLTNNALEFIRTKLQQAHAHWQEIADQLYIWKFTAFKHLLVYLRQVRRPRREVLQRYIRIGIYGNNKNKFSQTVQKKMNKIMGMYQSGLNDQQI